MSTDESEHEEYNHRLQQYLHNNTTLNESVLKLRYGLMSNFDVINDQATLLEASQPRASQAPSYVKKHNLRRLAEIDTELNKLGSEESRLLDDLKSESAVLNNSLRLFPMLISNALIVAEKEVGHDFAEEIEEIARQVLIATLRYSAPEFRHTLERIRMAQEYRQGTMEPVISLLSHAQIILRLKPSAEVLISNLLHLSREQLVKELGTICAEDFATETRRHHYYCTALFIFSILTVGCASRGFRPTDSVTKRAQQHLGTSSS